MADKTAAVKPKPKAKKKGGFFTGLKAEWNKVVWTSRENLLRQTIAVVAVSALTAFLITLIDSGAIAVIEKIIG